MKCRFLFSFFLFMFVFSSLTSQEWKRWNSKEGKFSVMTPGVMEAKRAFLDTGIGEIELHTLYFHNKDTTGNFLYLINYYDLPEGTIPSDSTDLAMEFLLNSMDQSVSDIDGDLQYNQAIQVGRHPGLLWRSRSEKQVVKSRAYVINNRFYMLQVFSIPDKALNREVDRFLESFTLISS